MGKNVMSDSRKTVGGVSGRNYVIIKIKLTLGLGQKEIILPNIRLFDVFQENIIGLSILHVADVMEHVIEEPVFRWGFIRIVIGISSSSSS